MIAMTLSMLVSLALYAWAFGFKFAVGFIILLLIHELGHVLASRVVGVRTSKPVFVPFIGAVVNLRRPPVNAKMEANIAIGGPAAGTLSALGCLVFYLWTNSSLMLILTLTACVMNLFNLIPLSPLDGGKVAAAISPRMWLLGDLVLLALVIYTHNVFIFIIFVVSLVQLWFSGRDKEHQPGENYYCTPLRQRVKVALWYFGLLSVLGVTTLYVLKVLG